jgi:2-hydroxychromene-2-carboxylate isomerase
MTKTVDYFFTPISPWTYMGFERFLGIAKRHRAQINFKPCNLGEIFPATGGLPLAKRAPARQAYRLQELERWRDYLGIPLTIKPKFFPANDALAARMIIAAKREKLDCGALAMAFHKVTWTEERDIADPGVLKGAAGAHGFDGAALLTVAESDAVKNEYAANAKEAIERGVFGAPTYVYKDQIYWGQDRLDFVERALAKG